MKRLCMTVTMMVVVLVVACAFAAETMDGKTYQLTDDCIISFDVQPFGPGENGDATITCFGKEWGVLGFNFVPEMQSGKLADQFPFWVTDSGITIAVQFLEGKEK